MDMTDTETRFRMKGEHSQNPLGETVLRALEATGGWNIDALREPGFRSLEAALHDPQFRALVPFPDNAQRVIDNAVVSVGMARLTFAKDIIAAGLTYNLSDPLSITELEWYAQNKVGNASRVMTPSDRGENFSPGVTKHRLPVYLTISRFQLDIRTLRMSQRLGLPLDTAGIESATRAVNENIEDAAINGATTLDGQALTVDGYTAPGLMNAPNAETQNLTAAAWTTVPVGSTVFAETQAMVAKLVANKKFGSYNMYVGTQIDAALNSDYDTVSGSRGLTIRERLLKIPNISAIKPADYITNGNGASPSIGNKVALVQMTKDVIDMVMGQQPTVIPWTSVDGFTFHNLIMAIMIPRVRSDYNSDSGICIGTTA